MMKKRLLPVELWLSAGQLEYNFRLSGSCFGCPGRTDNQNFEHCPVCPAFFFFFFFFPFFFNMGYNMHFERYSDVMQPTSCSDMIK